MIYPVLKIFLCDLGLGGSSGQPGIAQWPVVWPACHVLRPAGGGSRSGSRLENSRGWQARECLPSHMEEIQVHGRREGHSGIFNENTPYWGHWEEPLWLNSTLTTKKFLSLPVSNTSLLKFMGRRVYCLRESLGMGCGILGKWFNLLYFSISKWGV